ncbi:hypothetical protein [Peptostreptococcus equinus]|uniref:Uncharacterized protein n=1 Tax=Peptostreptococcus equinus TaxID=3003601 RepID=A0ABY7JV34_9FIRM|nr:hypothetical protein [Peptostreptococcus sp. CBA3647]WAW15752.1 hypothetical protein O0R46_04685 [Peptostreptococcus sp. CBA3647]
MIQFIYGMIGCVLFNLVWFLIQLIKDKREEENSPTFESIEELQDYYFYNKKNDRTKNNEFKY